MGAGFGMIFNFLPIIMRHRNAVASVLARRRCTEEYARKIHTPSPTFNCVDPCGVGTGFAGMRVPIILGHRLTSGL